MGWFIFFLIVFALGFGWFYLSKQQQKESNPASSPTPEATGTLPDQVTLNTIDGKLGGIGKEIGEIKTGLARIEKKLEGEEARKEVKETPLEEAGEEKGQE